ncbi:larval cuticle protein A2B-like [Anopheles nili]|uniref:larval cuticle protein A2B-like n=1 Tax=Anopheles nili TaxID=185578 RepID=UPI00237ABCA9|nr:larval cuticle protein A2B-like [Anopheles nili]
MPAHVQQDVLSRLIPMLVLLTIAAALPVDPTEAVIDQQQAPGERKPVQYEFAYGVKDPGTGDHKDHWERRDGDRVQGVYLFEEADGTQRIVEYEADDEHGFRAIVTNVELTKGSGQKAPSDGLVAHSYSMLRAVS